MPAPNFYAGQLDYINQLNALVALVNAVSPPTFVDKETPTGTINSTNTTFGLANTPNPLTSLIGYLRSGGAGAFLPLIKDIDFTVSGSIVTMTLAPKTSSNLFFAYRH